MARSQDSKPSARGSIKIWMRPPVMLAAFAAVTLGVVEYYVGVRETGWMATVLRGWVVNGGLALAIVAAATLGGSPIVRRLTALREPSLVIASAAALGLGIQGLEILGLGLLGFLRFSAGIVAMTLPAALGCVDLLLHRRAASSSHETKRRAAIFRPVTWGWLWLAAAPFLAIALCGASTFPGLLWKPADPHPYDVMSYHLQVPREWYEAGRITALDHNVFSYFPFGAETLDLLAMELAGGPWKGMYVAQFLSLIYVVLTAAAVHGGVVALAEFYGTDRRRAAAAADIAAVATAVVPWVAMLGSVAYVESLMLLHVATATAWAAFSVASARYRLRHAALAGLLAGLACGTKYTAVPMTLIALSASAAVAALCTRRRLGPNGSGQSVVAVPLTILITGMLTLAPWLVRNAIWTGNPVFPLALRTLGRGRFTEAQVERFEAAHVAPPRDRDLTGRSAAFFREVIANWQYGFLLIPLGFAAAIAMRRRHEGVLLSTSLATILLVWLLFTHLIGRFFVAAIPVAGLSIGLWCAAGRSPARLWVGAGVAVLAAFVGLLGLPFRTSSFDPQGLASCYAPMAAKGQAGMFFLMDVSLIDPPELNSVENGERGLALVGDAQPFFHQTPTPRLLYRTVFDVNVPPGVNVIDGWLGKSVEALRRKGYWVIVNNSELARLSRTYKNIPPLPPGSNPDIPQVILPPTSNVK